VAHVYFYETSTNLFLYEKQTSLIPKHGELVSFKTLDEIYVVDVVLWTYQCDKKDVRIGVSRFYF
jgi:hypothetical protein